MTTAAPACSAGIASPSERISGKFQGLMIADHRVGPVLDPQLLRGEQRRVRADRSPRR